MTISERINKKFNSHGVTIEESIKNANVGGGSAGYSVETKETVIYEGTGLKDQWVYDSENNFSELSPINAAFDDTMETLNVAIDGETKTFVRTTGPAGSAAWAYPETFETYSDMEIVRNPITSAYALSVYDREVSYDSVKISNELETITVADDFKKAVGIADGVMVVHSTVNSSNKYVLDKTWQEIHDFEGLVIIHETNDDGKVTSVVTLVGHIDNIYAVYVDHKTTIDDTAYSCLSPNGYPVKGNIA